MSDGARKSSRIIALAGRAQRYPAGNFKTTIGHTLLAAAYEYSSLKTCRCAMCKKKDCGMCPSCKHNEKCYGKEDKKRACILKICTKFSKVDTNGFSSSPGAMDELFNTFTFRVRPYSEKCSNQDCITCGYFQQLGVCFEVMVTDKDEKGRRRKFWTSCISNALPSIAIDYTNDCKETLLQKFLLKLVKPNIGRAIESSWDNHHNLCGRKRVFQWQTGGIGSLEDRRTRIKTEITSVMFEDFEKTPSRCRLQLLRNSPSKCMEEGYVPNSLPDRLTESGVIEVDYSDLVANPDKYLVPEFVEVLLNADISPLPIRLLHFQHFQVMLYAKTAGEKCGYGLFFRVMRKPEGEGHASQLVETDLYLDLGCYASVNQAIPEHVFEIKDLLRPQTGAYAWSLLAEQGEVNGRQLTIVDITDAKGDPIEGNTNLLERANEPPSLDPNHANVTMMSNPMTGLPHYILHFAGNPMFGQEREALVFYGESYNPIRCACGYGKFKKKKEKDLRVDLDNKEYRLRWRILNQWTRGDLQDGINVMAAVLEKGIRAYEDSETFVNFLLLCHSVLARLVSLSNAGTEVSDLVERIRGLTGQVLSKQKEQVVQKVDDSFQQVVDDSFQQYKTFNPTFHDKEHLDEVLSWVKLNFKDRTTADAPVDNDATAESSQVQRQGDLEVDGQDSSVDLQEQDDLSEGNVNESNADSSTDLPKGVWIDDDGIKRKKDSKGDQRILCGRLRSCETRAFSKDVLTCKRHMTDEEKKLYGLVCAATGCYTTVRTPSVGPYCKTCTKALLAEQQDRATNAAPPPGPTLASSGRSQQVVPPPPPPPRHEGAENQPSSASIGTAGLGNAPLKPPPRPLGPKPTQTGKENPASIGTAGLGNAPLKPPPRPLGPKPTQTGKENPASVGTAGLGNTSLQPPPRPLGPKPTHTGKENQK